MKKLMTYVIALVIVLATLTPIASTVEAATTTLTTYTTKTAVYLRSTPSYKGKKLILIPKQKAVAYRSKKGTWVKVRYANRTGYVNEQSLTRKVQKGVAMKAAPYVTQRQVIVYSRVDADKKQVFTLKKGTTVTVNEQLAGYYKIRYGSKTGWVATKYMKKVTVAAPKPIKKTPFLPKQASINYLKNYKSATENRLLFTIKSEHGHQFVNSHLFQTTVPMDEYLFVIGGYDQSKLSSLLFVRSRYDKYPTGQATGDEAVHAGLAAFFGEGTEETEMLRNLYAQHKYFEQNEVIPIKVGGQEGILLLWEKRIEFIFDYDGDLPIITI